MVFYKDLIFVFILSLILNLIFYLLYLYNLNEYGNLNHIAILGLLLFIPFLKNKNIKNCSSTALLTGLVIYLPLILTKFDILNLIVIFIYLLGIIFIICRKY